MRSMIPKGGEQPISVGQTVQQSCCAGVVADLASSYEEANWATTGVSGGMQFGVHATLCLADQASTPPFFTHRLEAVPLSHMLCICCRTTDVL